ncbi:tetratricopeptide repeat protein [Dysgonomonas sp. HGC4]|nr:tetratricopeptide repeat protein [Dysgonomonas sp. HGC4]MBD8347384.1 hypothetical protein [Dysgonomonas sp. HGC4]
MRTLIYLTIFFIGYYPLLKAQNNYPIIDEYIASYQFDKALIVIENENQTKELQEKRAISYKGLDNYSKAIEVLSSLSQAYPEDLQIKSEMALCYQALSNWSAGLNCYNALIELDSVNIYYKIKRADMLYRLDNYKDALVDYKALTDDYKLSNMIKRSAQCFENMNELDSAMAYYSKAIEADTMDVFSIASLININIKQKNFEEAMRLSDSFVEKDSTNRQINLLNGLSYYGADFYEDAVSRFRRCYLNGDSSLVVNRSLGISYYSLGQNEEALPFLLKAYAQDSTNLRVLYCLGVISNEIRDYANSVTYFGTLLDRTIPADMYLYLYFRGLAKGYEGLEEYKEAVDNYEEATRYGTRNQNMYLNFTLATIYDYDLRQADKALNYYLKYQASLRDYLEELKRREDKDETHKLEMTNVESSIKTLNSQIGRLEKEVAKVTTD